MGKKEKKITGTYLHNLHLADDTVLTSENLNEMKLMLQERNDAKKIVSTTNSETTANIGIIT